MRAAAISQPQHQHPSAFGPTKSTVLASDAIVNASDLPSDTNRHVPISIEQYNTSNTNGSNFSLMSKTGYDFMSYNCPLALLRR